MNLETVVLGNAAGFVKTYEQAKKLLAVPTLTRITIGSVRLHEWPGNSGDVYYYDAATKTAWNSKGLDSPGLEALMKWLPDFYAECKAARKQLVVSVAGTSPAEYAMTAGRIAPYCDLVEINVGCGNMWGTTGQKSIPSYEPQLLRMIIFQVSKAVERPMLAVKISPVDDRYIFPLIDVLNGFDTLVEVIGCNTKILQEGTRPDGSPALAFKEPNGTEVRHQGGMSGAPLKAESMHVLGSLIPLLDHVRFIGCGGVSSGQDLLDYLALGTAGVEVGTEFGEHGPRVFERIMTEAAALFENA
jgi:dihydroorotate dehydrogenase